MNAWQQRRIALPALMILRVDYLPRSGLPQVILNTQFDFVYESNRRQLSETIIPLLNDPNHRALLQDALNEQMEWPSAELGKSAWSKSRRMAEAAAQAGLTGMEEAQKEDLLVLGYHSLVSALPDGFGINRDKLLRSIEDFLLNEFYLLEEVRLAWEANSQRQPPSPPSEQPGGVVFQVLQYNDLITQMHLQNAVTRIRAGWDKLMTNLVLGSFESRGLPDRFPKKIKAVQRMLQSGLSSYQRSLLDNYCLNASTVAVSPLLRFRDDDLHFVSHQATETFGRPGHDPSIDDFWAVVLSEYQRLEQSFLLIIAMLKLYSSEKANDRSVHP
ncbi:MAG: hypothetical protein HYY02_06100 [Chloroflexi bacterium]|nr:hypothetical protein [Chloroflexota bacterium]